MFYYYIVHNAVYLYIYMRAAVAAKRRPLCMLCANIPLTSLENRTFILYTHITYTYVQCARKILIFLLSCFPRRRTAHARTHVHRTIYYTCMYICNINEHIALLCTLGFFFFFCLLFTLSFFHVPFISLRCCSRALLYSVHPSLHPD